MKLSHQASILFWGRLSSHAAIIVRAMFLSRLMPKEEYGSYGQAMMLGALVTPYLVLGLDVAIPFFFARLSEARQKGLSMMLCAYLSLAGIVTAGALFFASSLFADWWDNPQLESLLKYYAFVVAFMQLPVIVPPALLSKRRPILAGMYLPAVEIPGVAAVILTFYLTRDVTSMFVVMAVLRGLHCLAGVFLTVHLPFQEIGWALDRTVIRDVFKYALPLGAAAILGQTSMAIDKLYISYYFNASDFAVYRIGSFELPVFALVTSSIFTVLLPEMSRLVHAGKGLAAIRLWGEGVRRTAIIIVPTVVFAFVFAGEVILVLFSSRYAESVPVFRIYTASLLIRVAQYACVFVAFGRPRLILVFSVLGLAVNAVGGLSFIKLFPLLGLPMFLGPCSAALAVRYLRVLATVAVMARVAGVPFRELLPWGSIMRILACSVAGSAAAYPLVWVRFLDGLEVLRLILAAPIAVGVFSAAAWYSGTIKRADVEFVIAPVLRRWDARRSRGRADGE